MKCTIICDEGFENIVAKNLEELYDIKADIAKTALSFDLEKNEDSYLLLAELCYKFQGAIKVLSDVVSFEAELELNEDKLTEIAKEFEKGVTFKPSKLKVSCVRKGEHNYKSVTASDVINKSTFNGIERSYKTADMEVLCYIKDEVGIIGIDISGRALNKRDYKIFLGSTSLRGTVGYDLLCYAEYKQGEVIVDPFMGCGTIPIEAGLFVSGISPFFFTKEKFAFRKLMPGFDWDSWFKEMDSDVDKSPQEIYGYDSLLKFLKHSQKNAKIGDVNKVIQLSKVEIDWIDTKFEEDSVDKIITHPPALTEHGSKTKILRVYRDMFNRCSDILKEQGQIYIINTPKSIEEMEKIAEMEDFELVDKKTVFEGQQEFMIAKFEQAESEDEE